MSIFRFNPKTPILLVTAEIVGPHGGHFIRMILDTGASYTMIHPDALVKIGCDPVSSEKRKITTASSVEYVPFITVPEIRCLGKHLPNVEITVHDIPSALPAEGLLGLNFLRHFDLHLNFRKGEIEILP